MKKVISLFAGFVFMSAVVFGAPKAIRFPSTIGNDVPESELVKVTFKSSIVVVAIDGVENKDEFLNLKPENCDRVYEIDEIANSAGLCFRIKNQKSSNDVLVMSVY